MSVLLILLITLSTVGASISSDTYFQQRNVTVKTFGSNIVMILPSHSFCAMACLNRGHSRCSIFQYDSATSQCVLYPYQQSSYFNSNGTARDPVVTVYYRQKRCQPGWINGADSISCYSFVLVKLTHSSASRYCQTLGANTDLATVRSVEDNKRLVALMAEAVNSSAGGMVTRETTFLIKLNDMYNEAQFRWDEYNYNTLSLWANGEPNNVMGADCVHVSFEGKWDDLSCSAQRYFVCEMF